ncbi:MAG: ATP-binding protein [Candidatus Goldiibacteriota bacterium]
MAVKNIAGNPRMKTELLIRAGGEKTGTAYIFSGAENTGKSFAALQFAKILNCLDPGDGGDCCEKCENCVLLEKIFHRLDSDGMQTIPHPDALYINTDKAQIVIDMVLDRLSEMNSYRPVKLKKKIIMVNDAEKLNSVASNAILKELEEPNENVVIMLIVNNMEKMLPTIVSRCHKINVKRVPLKEIKSILETEYGWDPEKASRAVMFCDGKIGAAFEYEKIKEKVDYVKGIFSVISGTADDVEGIFEKIEEIDGLKKAKKGKKDVNIRLFLLDILKILSYIYKDILLEKLSVKRTIEAKYGLNPAQIKSYTEKQLVKILELIEEAQRETAAANINLLVADLFFNIRKAGLSRD